MLECALERIDIMIKWIACVFEFMLQTSSKTLQKRLFFAQLNLRLKWWFSFQESVKLHCILVESNVKFDDYHIAMWVNICTCMGRIIERRKSWCIMRSTTRKTMYWFNQKFAFFALFFLCFSYETGNNIRYPRIRIISYYRNIKLSGI